MVAIAVLISSLVMQTYKQGEIVDAAKKGDVKLLERCVEAGADVNEESIGGSTPLMFAAGFGHTAAVEFLLARKANPNIRCDGGSVSDSALGWAAQRGHKDVCEKLLWAGAKNSGMECWTPADAARRGGHKEIATMILLWDQVKPGYLVSSSCIHSYIRVLRSINLVILSTQPSVEIGSTSRSSSAWA